MPALPMVITVFCATLIDQHTLEDLVEIQRFAG